MNCAGAIGALCALGVAVVSLAAAQTPPVQTPPAPSQAAIDRASEILTASRTAMGGERLAAIRSIVATGQTKRVRGNNLVPIEFEIVVELPDKYVRTDEVPAEESGACPIARRSSRASG